MIGWILTRPLALLTGAVGGAAASQVPTFQSAYLNYLQGRVDEANRTAQIAQQELNRAMETMGVASAEALVTAILHPPTRVLEVPQQRIGQLIG